MMKLINDLTNEDVNDTSSEWSGAVNHMYNKQGSISSFMDDNEKTESKDLSIVEEESPFYEEKYQVKRII